MHILEPSPPPSAKNIINSCLGNFIFFRKSLASYNSRNIFLSNAKNFLISKFGICVFNAFGVYSKFTFSSALFIHIFHICALCSKKQMIWSYTSRIIAFMQHVKICLKFSVDNFISNSMCLLRFVLIKKVAISAVIFSSFPNPTGFRSPHFAPKSLA